jgi:hypothetical protein
MPFFATVIKNGRAFMPFFAALRFIREMVKYNIRSRTIAEKITVSVLVLI